MKWIKYYSLGSSLAVEPTSNGVSPLQHMIRSSLLYRKVILLLVNVTRKFVDLILSAELCRPPAWKMAVTQLFWPWLFLTSLPGHRSCHRSSLMHHLWPQALTVNQTKWFGQPRVPRPSSAQFRTVSAEQCPLLSCYIGGCGWLPVAQPEHKMHCITGAKSPR